MDNTKEASSFLTREIMEKFMCCYLCKKDHKEPTLLPCGHTYCFSCLENHYRQNEDDSSKCPVCDVEITMPEDGLRGFPLNVSINSLKSASVKKMDKSKCIVCKFSGKDVSSTHVCRTCQDPLCPECAVAHPKSSLTHDHVVVVLKKEDAEMMNNAEAKIACLQHKDQELCFYCKTCSMPICSTCKIVDDHAQHSCVDLSTVLKTVKADIVAPLKDIDVAYRCFSSNVKRLVSMKDDLNRQCNYALEQVRQRGEILREVINQIESDTLEKVQQIRTEKTQQLEDLITSTEEKVKEVHDAKIDASALIDKAHAAQILTIHKTVQKYLVATAENVKHIRGSAKLAKWTDVIVQGPSAEDIKNVLQLSFGSVLVTQSDCHRLAEFKVDDQVSSLAVMNDQIIIGSQKENTLKIFDMRGNLEDEFELGNISPCDVASQGNELFVADANSDQIRVFIKDKDGKYHHKGQMSLTNDEITEGNKYVCLDSHGRVFVSYEKGRRVNVYNKQKQLCSVVSRERFHPAVYAGLHVATFGLYSLYQHSKNTDMWSPRNIAISRNGTLFIASHQPSKIQAVNPAGDQLFSLNVPLPSSLSVDTFQNVVVSEGGMGGKILLVSSSGEILHDFVLKGEKVVIRASTFDKAGNFIIAYSDADGDKVVISSYVYTMNIKGSEE